MTKEEVLEVLRKIYDPDYQDKSIVDMGLAKEEDISFQGEEILVSYGLTAPLCPFSAAIGLMIKYALHKKLGVPVVVRLKATHHQSGVVAEMLQDSQRSKELMEKLREFGILEQCVRL